MSIAKEKYRQFCMANKNLPVFLHDWWLDTVCGDNWDATIVESGNEISAVMPYVIRHKAGMKLLNMPLLTSFLGPWVNYPVGQKYVSRMSFETEAQKKLIEQLPAFAFFRQRFHYSITNWLPFYWKGFKQTTRYSYIIELNDVEQIFNELKSSVRGKIRKAAELVAVTTDRSVEDFYTLFTQTFHRQGLKPPVSLEYMKKIDSALSSRNQRKIFVAIDAEGKLHSALYLIWDGVSSYVHMVGENPELRNSGAGSLLIWEAIQYTKHILKLNQFDFLGSMIESVETVRRSFGARQVPYFQVTKVASLPLKVLSVFRKDLL
jgi:lipid II:glycine glycyltransferase (peptidoglycan interpeptide bridge formation enzyme)